MATEKVTFAGHGGHALAARLDLPVGPPAAYALFAHCFTCSKDTLAASRIAGALAQRRIATLRFDFTGLGGSHGEFANTDFSSNVADLVAAASHLRATRAAPALLIGHSLGGAAVLAAAGDIPEVRAVATIGAPADPGHVVEQFAADLDRIASEGAAEVTLAGRRFTIRREFLEDLGAQRLAERIGALRRALLVLHAPRDATVGVENATAIFLAAKHPRSFVSLDDADHLLTRPSDAAYAAEVIAAWAARYLRAPPPVPAAEPAAGTAARVAETGAGAFEQTATVGRHRLTVDEPPAVGGGGAGPDPYDLLAVALGACTGMTLRMYAGRKELALGRIAVTVGHAKVHAADCADCGEGREGRIDRFERVIEIEGGAPEGLAEKLLEIADKCPVHRTLEGGAAVVTRLADAPG
jgi:putative redox protein